MSKFRTGDGLMAQIEQATVAVTPTSNLTMDELDEMWDKMDKTLRKIRFGEQSIYFVPNPLFDEVPDKAVVKYIKLDDSESEFTYLSKGASSKEDFIRGLMSRLSSGMPSSYQYSRWTEYYTCIAGPKNDDRFKSDTVYNGYE